MNILAHDLGTRTGWALSEGGRIESGVQDFTPRRGESAGMRYLHFNRWLLRVHREGFREGQDRPCDLIVYEMPHLRGGAAATVLAGLQTRVEEFCATHGIEHAPVHSATLKKFTTGSGRGDKDAMKIAAKERGWLTRLFYIPEDDEVDAICLLHYALAEIIPTPTPGGAGAIS